MKVHFIDQTSVGPHHMVFNAALLLIIEKLYPNHNLIHHGIQSNQNEVASLLKANGDIQVLNNSIEYPLSRDVLILKAFNYLRKEWIRYMHFKNVLKSANDSDVIYLSITTFSSFYFFKRLCKKYPIRTFAVLHGDIDYLRNAKSKLEKINAYFHKQIFKIKLPHFKYIVLNKISKPLLVRDGYLNENELIDIHHPQLFESKALYEDESVDTSTLIIGHIGSMELERKQSHYIYLLGEMLHQSVDNLSLKLKILGLLTPSVLPFKNQYVEELVGNMSDNEPQYLSRATYEFELNQLDYVVFFYPTKEYILRASGVISDIVSKPTPIIALRHPLFEYYEDLVGEIGYLCENLEEMASLIKSLLVNRDLQRRQKQIDNLNSLKQLMTVDIISEDIRLKLK